GDYNKSLLNRRLRWRKERGEPQHRLQKRGFKSFLILIEKLARSLGKRTFVVVVGYERVKEQDRWIQMDTDTCTLTNMTILHSDLHGSGNMANGTRGFCVSVMGTKTTAPSLIFAIRDMLKKVDLIGERKKGSLLSKNCIGLRLQTGFATK